ncbi:MAG TPA: M15 family metallopeptidase, partial [Usitatibacteraceae bacterium]|nr:M15 family metallopeptidase [Usitatibacteraceae bacterium]
ELVFVETGVEGRDHFLAPQAAAAWHAMKAAAGDAGLTLVIASSFRSIDRQSGIIRGKLDTGLSIDEVLASVAPPGYSEHHTGRAVDIVSPDHPDLEDSFEATREFAWLAENAHRFGFVLSYPRGNAAGYVYEPWHWCFHPTSHNPAPIELHRSNAHAAKNP